MGAAPDVLARLQSVPGCGGSTQVYNPEKYPPQPHVDWGALHWANVGCPACALKLVEAIRATEAERVERETIERCAAFCANVGDDMFTRTEALAIIRGMPSMLRALARRYAGAVDHKEGAK